MSKEGKRKTDAFWFSLPLIERQFYAHEFKTGNRQDGWSMFFRELSDTPPQQRLAGNDCVNTSINSSPIRMDEVSRSYIVTQAPSDSMVADFWQMVWEQHSVGIVMLCKCAEGDADVCAHYWPTIGDDPLITGSLVVECISSDWSECYCVSRLKLYNLEAGETFELLHFLYFAWPESAGAVPSDPHSFAEFLMVVRESGIMQPGVGPPIVHCTTGTGRSGVFTLSDVALSWIEGARGMNTVDVGGLLSRLRQQRPGLVETSEELRFAYVTILNTAHYGLNLGRSIEDLVRDMDNFTESLIDEEIHQQSSRWASASPTRNQPQLYSDHPTHHPQPLLLPDADYFSSPPSSPSHPLDLGESHVAPFVELTPEDRGIFLQPLPPSPVLVEETHKDKVVQLHLELPAIAEDKAPEMAQDKVTETAQEKAITMAGEKAAPKAEEKSTAVGEDKATVVSQDQTSAMAQDKATSMAQDKDTQGKAIAPDSEEITATPTEELLQQQPLATLAQDEPQKEAEERPVSERDTATQENSAVPVTTQETLATPPENVTSKDKAVSTETAADETTPHPLNTESPAVDEHSASMTSSAGHESVSTGDTTSPPLNPAAGVVVVVEETFLPELQQVELSTPTEGKSGKRKKRRWFKRLGQTLFSCIRANRD